MANFIKYTAKERGWANLAIAEIGTAYGGNANHLLSSIPYARVFAVDPFMVDYDTKDVTSK